MADATDFSPKTNNAYDLGSLSNRWRQVYVGNTLTSTTGTFGTVDITTSNRTATLSASGITSGQTRTFTFPDGGSGSVVTTAGTQTISSKIIQGDENTITVDGTYGIGFRGIPVNNNGLAAFSSYTPVASDKDKVLAGTGSIVMPTNPFVVGDRFYFYGQNTLTFDTTAITCQVEGVAGTQASVTLASRSWGEAILIQVSPYVWLFRGAFS